MQIIHIHILFTETLCNKHTGYTHIYIYCKLFKATPHLSLTNINYNIKHCLTTFSRLYRTNAYVNIVTGLDTLHCYFTKTYIPHFVCSLYQRRTHVMSKFTRWYGWIIKKWPNTVVVCKINHRRKCRVFLCLWLNISCKVLPGYMQSDLKDQIVRMWLNAAFVCKCRLWCACLHTMSSVINTVYQVFLRLAFYLDCDSSVNSFLLLYDCQFCEQ